jgi:hypothetical protein
MTGGGFVAGAIVGKLLLDKTGWNESISSVGKDEAKLKDSAKQIGDSFQAAGKVMAIAGTAVVGALSAMIVKAARYGDEMVEVSQKVGINVTTLSSYKLAADKTGTSIDGMARGLKFLSANIVEASNGTGEGARIFKALGISVVDANGKLRNTDDVLADVAQAFSGLEGGAVKTTAAVKLFGRSGMEMIPFLDLGADGIKREREEAERLGLVLSGEAAEAQNHFKDQLDALKDATFGVAVTIGTALIPVVQGVVDSMIKFAAGITAAVKAHPELIKVLGAAGLALGTVGIAVGSVIMLLPRFIAGLRALQAILSTTALGVGMFTAALTVGVGVIVYYLSKLSELSTAEDQLQAATKALAETENQLVDKLSAAAVAAGWHYGRMAALIEVYHGNVAALTMAIKTGKEGVDIQNALAEVGKKHADVIEKQKKKMGEMDPIARALNEALQTQKKTTTELTETFTPLARGASFVRDVMQGFAGELTNTFIPAARNMTLVMAAAPEVLDATGDAASGLDLVFKAIGDTIGESAASVKIAMYNMAADVLAAYGIIIAKLPEFPAAAKVVTSETRNYFDGLFNDIAAGFGNTIQKWLEGATTFKNFMTGLWDNIKSAFFRMVGEMVAEWLVNFVKNLISGAVSAATSVGTSMASIGTSIGTLATTVGGILVTLVTSIGTAIVTLATAIATSVVTLATGIASAATILAAAAPAFIVVGLIALGIYATIAALKRLFAKAGSGAGDGMGRVVERQDIQISLLTQLRDLSRDTIADLDAIKTTLWAMGAAVGAVLSVSIKLAIWKISTATQQSSNYLKTAVGYLKDIAAKIGKLATPTKPVTPTKPFVPVPIFSVPAPSLQAFGAGMAPKAAPTSQSGTPVNLTFNVNAIDRAGVETFLRRDARPILQRMLANLELRPVAAGIGG